MKPISATIRLTSGYVVLIMSVSIFFSISLYEVNKQQVNAGLRRQADIFEQRSLYFGPPTFSPSNIEFLSAQTKEIQERLRSTLILINGVILLVGGSLSYIFAKRTLRPIEENLESQRRFTADASHELRTPLTAIRTELEVSLRSPKAPPEEYRRVMSSTLEEVQRLQDLSSRLLRLAQHDGPMEVTTTAVSLSGVWQDATRLVRAEAEKKGITIVTSTHEAALRGDHDSFVELFVILLDNAIKYSEPKTKVMLAAQVTNGKVNLTVTDQGIGIPEDDLLRVFDRFYRADASRTSQKAAGYGLGLPIAKQIVQRYKGNISLTSAVGKGTTVHLTLPLAA